MFHLPALCWRMLSNQSGLNVSVVLSLACQEENVDPEVRDRSIDILTVGFYVFFKNLELSGKH